MAWNSAAKHRWEQPENSAISQGSAYPAARSALLWSGAGSGSGGSEPGRLPTCSHSRARPWRENRTVSLCSSPHRHPRQHQFVNRTVPVGGSRGRRKSAQQELTTGNEGCQPLGRKNESLATCSPPYHTDKRAWLPGISRKARAWPVARQNHQRRDLDSFWGLDPQ